MPDQNALRSEFYLRKVEDPGWGRLSPSLNTWCNRRLPDMQCLPAARDRNAISSHEQWGGEHLLSNHIQPALLAKRCALDEEMAQLPTRPQGSSAGAAGLEFQTQICGLRNSGSLHQTSGFETGFCGSASGVLCKHFK